MPSGTWRAMEVCGALGLGNMAPFLIVAGACTLARPFRYSPHYDRRLLVAVRLVWVVVVCDGALAIVPQPWRLPLIWPGVLDRSVPVSGQAGASIFYGLDYHHNRKRSGSR